jgi:hypothetical protein
MRAVRGEVCEARHRRRRFAGRSTIAPVLPLGAWCDVLLKKNAQQEQRAATSIESTSREPAWEADHHAREVSRDGCRAKHLFEFVPETCILYKVADAPDRAFQVPQIESRKVPARNAYRIEDVLLSSCEDLEKS